MKCLVFDVWGDFAHFRKFYTTSSPLTFSFPPRTAVAGMISAIIGIRKEEYLKYFTKDQAYIAIRILKPVKKTRISYNLIDTKTAKMMSKISNRTQVTFELLKDCKFRIYFYHEDNQIYEKLKTSLKNHESFYTPCLGLSEFIANFNYIGEFELSEKNNYNYVLLQSIIPFNNEHIEVEFEDNKEYFKDTVPNEMNDDREVTEYLKILYERNGKAIKCKLSKFYELSEEERIVFL
ncbi:CRISPR-associated protein, Cas5h family [Clostridium sp. USBA 49]|uniref:type I-B CRISPR-associated protein Cas5b n=1 Tax=Clostridium sp. USBA 49 TaxID=1881060 RepID=UPI00099AB772|nr:type I-B CRISPR-associated protein Cas5b [Clostridium sp. USBA 49]SKA90407.1 CRISPR-associated protein, Cas5h family [Clostridium sp. USBA 49]